MKNNIYKFQMTKVEIHFDFEYLDLKKVIHCKKDDKMKEIIKEFKKEIQNIIKKKKTKV